MCVESVAYTPVELKAGQKWFGVMSLRPEPLPLALACRVPQMLSAQLSGGLRSSKIAVFISQQELMHLHIMIVNYAVLCSHPHAQHSQAHNMYTSGDVYGL